MDKISSSVLGSGPMIQQPRQKQIRKIMIPTENCCPTRLTSKQDCPCILEGRLSTTPILSALRLQAPKSNIYVHFPLINK